MKTENLIFSSQKPLDLIDVKITNERTFSKIRELEIISNIIEMNKLNLDPGSITDIDINTMIVSVYNSLALAIALSTMTNSNLLFMEFSSDGIDHIGTADSNSFISILNGNYESGIFKGSRINGENDLVKWNYVNEYADIVIKFYLS